MNTLSYAVVVDLGSSSGRVVVASSAGGDTLDMTEVHRFAHHAQSDGNHLVWDIDHLVSETITGLYYAKEAIGGLPATVAIDTWGVDYVLVDTEGNRTAPVVCYRDGRTHATQAAAETALEPAQHFALTGVQPETITTARQLFAQQATSEIPATADKMLLLPDYVAFCLTGSMGWSPTIASTTALTQPGSANWAEDVFDAYAIPCTLVGPLNTEMTDIGSVTVTGLENFTVVRAGGHDTACAVHGLGLSETQGFLSCGSWSLVGCVRDTPVLNDTAYRAGLSNEVCTDGKIRLLRNLTGLWILQQCCRVFAEQGRPSDIALLATEAADCPDPGVYIDTNDPVFAAPGDYPAIISERLAASGVEKHDSEAVIVRVVTASLARTHAATVRHLEEVTGTTFDSLRMIGGGVHNALLCQLTADECGIPVIAGPAEGTATGSAIAQLEIQGIERAALVRHVDTITYLPSRKED
ncbi:pentulose/hexulose kinase [Corynebacterium mustelae]|uniref:Pentulose/hexulose kinase n=1 Tax=Corynebacterium mustelae TaxID=571915 RepID=A0A0G3GWA2_9CORY|nr:FGGY-family carbohydrate kinase [Corynebacterium mustelae]AKK04805.1 pentulose/hexulose kinase [Corynebacterium mustelae]